jgi:hypothetical protein
LLAVSGVTSDGSRVISGVFKLVESQGIPLDLLLDHFRKNNLIVDWVDFYNTARTFNWNIRTIMARIEESVTIAYGRDYCSNLMDRLRFATCEQSLIDNSDV